MKSDFFDQQAILMTGTRRVITKRLFGSMETIIYRDDNRKVVEFHLLSLFSEKYVLFGTGINSTRKI